MICLDFPPYLMETLKWWRSLHGYMVVLMFLTMVSKGSACVAPSSPHCFRRNTSESVYMCEWSMTTTERNVIFDFYFNETKFGSFKQNRAQFIEERLIKYRPVNIWVEAHEGNSSCASTKRSVVLGHIVKYEAPQYINVSWLKNNLNVSWTAAEEHVALAEVRFRRFDHPTESWEERTLNTSLVKYQSTNNFVTVTNLLKHTAYQIQIRQRSIQAQSPLWSDWSKVVDAPAELEQPIVTVSESHLNGTRKVTLKWKPISSAAAVRGVTSSLTDTQSAHGCPCHGKKHPSRWNLHTTYVSYSAVNISVITRNAAGHSPPAIIELPPAIPADLKPCTETLVHKKLNKRTCLELYEIQGEDWRPEKVTILKTGRKKKKQAARTAFKDYVRYIYFEHICNRGRPQTVKMCIFYEKEGVPLTGPQGFVPSGETQTSVDLSWKAIRTVDQRGFLTHYKLCRVKISTQEEPEECYNISASLTKHRLENLSTGTKYNISLVGVTRVGEGPTTIIPISTQPEKTMNVLWSLSLLFVFFFISTMCTFVLKRVGNKIFPPVPKPVIPPFTPHQPENQQMLENKEEVHKLTLYQLQPEARSTPEDAEETTTIRGGEWEDDSDEDERGDSRMSGENSDEPLSDGSTDEAQRSSRDKGTTNVEQLDNELAMLIYRNGLVFDTKTD